MKKTINKTDKLLIKKMFRYILPHKVLFICTVVCVLGGIGLGLIYPLLWGKLITDIFSRNYFGMIRNVIFITIFSFIQMGVIFLQAFLFSHLSNNLIYSLKVDIYKKILDLPIKAFDHYKKGELIARVHEDTSNIADIITDQVLNAGIDIFKVIIIGIIIFRISIPLSLIVIISFPISYFIFLKAGKVLREKNNKLMKYKDKYFNELQETITGIREIKSLHIKKQRVDFFESLSNNLKTREINVNIVSVIFQNISQGVNILSQLTILLIGGILIFKGILLMEYFIAFSAYSKQFSDSLMNITELNSNIQKVLTSLERISDLEKHLAYNEEKFGKKELVSIKKHIKFENIYFGYEHNRPILNGISFTIQNSKKIAIVGPSGSGKTTIINLLLRFYEPSSGKITVDDVNIIDFSEKSLRKNIAIVSQSPYLFNLSIKENLILGNTGATMKEIEKACKSACIYDYIMSLPKKYDTIIEENGNNISVGQKQRIAIARALIKKSNIIILDEATSAVDNESQHYIKKAINKISGEHIIIVIAHRLSTIIDADKIIVVKNGKIVGQDTHEGLMKSNKVYKRLYQVGLRDLKNTKVEA